MNNLIPIEFNNQRIMTTKILADEFGTEEKNIQMNFSNNQSRFIEGKHYVKLWGQALKDFKNSLPNEIRKPLKFVPQLILWTDRGVARHAKILETDEAWEVYEQLEETYFRVKQNNIEFDELSPALKMFKQMFQVIAQDELEQKKLQRSVTETKKEVQDIRDVITLNPSAAWRMECNRILNAIGRETGDYKAPKDQVYTALKTRASCRPNVLISNLQKRAKANGMAPSKIEKLNLLDVLENEPRLKEIYVTIVKEMAVKNKVSLRWDM
ncbi:ORF6N domain-containing protein [Clostridium akagii]|uniref:ORF6N domain-containing protein n=1 Tax=Clostridium akagii TaxID=91623 RepID=UPI00047E2284|nr:ORF6N domain-containing protein [Clostridium akagii]